MCGGTELVLGTATHARWYWGGHSLS